MPVNTTIPKGLTCGLGQKFEIFWNFCFMQNKNNEKKYMLTFLVENKPFQIIKNRFKKTEKLAFLQRSKSISFSSWI